MSRVEPKSEEQQRREAEQRNARREPVDRTPTKAEGDEETVNEALRHEGKK